MTAGMIPTLRSGKAFPSSVSKRWHRPESAERAEPTRTATHANLRDLSMQPDKVGTTQARSKSATRVLKQSLMSQHGLKLVLATLLASVLVGAPLASAVPISQEQADQFANDFAYLHGWHLQRAGWVPTSGQSDPTAEPVGTLNDSSGNTVAYKYRLPTGGNIVVVNETELAPVFFYSETNEFYPNAHDTAEVLFKRLVARVACARLDDNEVPHPLWSATSDRAIEFHQLGAEASGIAQTTIAPLIETTWSQGDPYNQQCPRAAGGERCVVGCVATAMAQIMRYWQHPQRGTGSVDYMTDMLGINVVIDNLGEPPFDWGNMPTELTPSSTTAQIDAVAQLSYYCGGAVRMDYTPFGSGAWSDDARDALVYNFQYLEDATYLYRGWYDDATWSAGMQDEIESLRPVYYDGTNEDYSSAHAFILDGIQEQDDGSWLYHFNLGWGGVCDGWYDLDMSTGSEESECADELYPLYQGAIVRIGAGHALHVQTVPPGAGAVIRDVYTLVHGGVVAVELRAEAYPGYRFTYWIVDGASVTQNPTAVVVGAEKTVQAYFETAYALAVKIEGGGQVTISPSSSTGYDAGTVVTLTAEAEEGWCFDHWDGDVTGTTNPTTITMDENKTVRAVFDRLYTLTVIHLGDGQVDVDPAGRSFSDGAEVTLTADADDPWSFRRWWGDVTGSDPTVTIVMDADKIIQAEFVRTTGAASYPLSVVIVGQGRVTPFGGLIEAGTTVSLRAVPASGWEFVRWEGAVMGTSNPIDFDVNEETAVTAVFVLSDSADAIAAGQSQSQSVKQNEQQDDLTAASQDQQVSDDGVSDLTTGCLAPGLVILTAVLLACALLTTWTRPRT